MHLLTLALEFLLGFIHNSQAFDWAGIVALS